MSYFHLIATASNINTTLFKKQDCTEWAVDHVTNFYSNCQKWCHRPKGKWSTTQIAIAQHPITHTFLKKSTAPHIKWNCSNQLNLFFEQFLFSESRRSTGGITSARITTAQISTAWHVGYTCTAAKTCAACAAVKSWTCAAVKSWTCAPV